jgi:hypothetical protein
MFINNACSLLQLFQSYSQALLKLIIGIFNQLNSPAQ